MTAPAALHRCAYQLRVGTRWVCVSSCHYGAVLPLPTTPERQAS